MKLQWKDKPCCHTVSAIRSTHHTQTQSSIGLKSSRGSQHHHTGRFERVFFREDQLSVIETTFVGRSLAPLDHVVHFQNVGLVRRHTNDRIVNGFLSERRKLLRQASSAHIAGHDGRLMSIQGDEGVKREVLWIDGLKNRSRFSWEWRTLAPSTYFCPWGKRKCVVFPFGKMAFSSQQINAKGNERSRMRLWITKAVCCDKLWHG